jgi:hypothetical protein
MTDLKIAPKVIVTVLYPRQGMSSFDMEYYLKHHIPKTNAAWSGYGMTNCTVCEVDKESEFAIQVTMTWRDMNGWNAAQNAGSTQDIMADIDHFRFTNVRPITIVSTVID